ncbi:MAG TPA: serine hydrolase domain-containing protein [Pyrinomonadaceae bacterium]|jgi:CubicO group peptidase (beta-lactamase class C family)
MHEGERNEEISAYLGERIAEGDFPSAVYLVAERGRVQFRDALGHAVLGPPERRAALDTIYDLASLTKPLVTGMLCARYVEKRELKLDAEVRTYLPEFDTPEKRAVTLRHLLTHTSGLPAWRPLYITTGGRKSEALSEIASAPLEAAVGTRVRYSDLGFITLGLLLERISGGQLKEVARREIFEPLGLNRTFFNPEMALQTETAACETGNLYERGMCGEMKLGESYTGWREQLIWGEVHDGNAHFLGGAAGHAGLFSTAVETLRLAEQFLSSRTQLLEPETCALFHTNMTEGLEEARSFAWQLAGTKDSTAGQDLPFTSFGHTGFTGTSCWIDATRERVFLLFTNRTHGARSLPFVNINGVRRRFHSMAARALG